TSVVARNRRRMCASNCRTALLRFARNDSVCTCCALSWRRSSIRKRDLLLAAVARYVIERVAAMVVAVRMAMRRARILAENERLDRDRHGLRRHADAAEIDVVEVPQGNSVHHQHLGSNLELLAQQPADRVRNVAVENKKQRLAVSDGVAQPLRDSPCERGDAFIRGRSLPAESERNFVLAFRQVEGSEVVLNGARKLVRIYFAGQAVGRLEDL